MERQTLTIAVFLICVFATAPRARLQPEGNFQSSNNVRLTLPLHNYVEINTAVTIRFLVPVTWKIKVEENE
ncbi:MAG: hypothetical protein ABJB34_12980, partial [Acidobacteriota bacterium]